MDLLDAGSCGWCLRWPATASGAVHRQGDERHVCCGLVSARGPGDGGEVLKGSRRRRWSTTGFIVPVVDCSAPDLSCGCCWFGRIGSNSQGRLSRWVRNAPVKPRLNSASGGPAHAVSPVEAVGGHAEVMNETAYAYGSAAVCLLFDRQAYGGDVSCGVPALAADGELIFTLVGSCRHAQIVSGMCYYPRVLVVL